MVVFRVRGMVCTIIVEFCYLTLLSASSNSLLGMFVCCFMLIFNVSLTLREHRLNARTLLRTKRNEMVTFGGTEISDSNGALEIHRVRTSTV